MTAHFKVCAGGLRLLRWSVIVGGNEGEYITVNSKMKQVSLCFIPLTDIPVHLLQKVWTVVI